MPFDPSTTLRTGPSTTLRTSFAQGRPFDFAQGRASATSNDGVAWVEELCEALQVPSLASYGVTAEDLPVLIEKAFVASSMQGNPIRLTAGEMQEILTRAL